MESNILTTNESFICVLDSRNATTYYNGSYNSLLTFNIEDAIKIDGIKMMCCVDSFTMPNSIYNINELNNMLSLSVPQITMSTVTGTYSSSFTSGLYTIYQFNSSGSITFTGGTPTIYILSVAGGGSGGSGVNGGGGGGGAGGMVQQTCTLTTNNTLNITVGAGGVVNSNGGNTTVNFSADTNFNITSIGGGFGGINSIPGNSGGSGGGNARDSNLGGSSGTINQGQNGGTTTGTMGWGGSSGGGGAGLIGGYGGNAKSGATTGEYEGYGGDGLLCTLNGISGLYPTYYWAGGGGGANGNSNNSPNNTPYGTKTSTIAASTTNSTNSGNGGLGGGGAGAGPNAGGGTGYGGAGLNNGGNRGSNWSSGNGGANTGGGGGGGGSNSVPAGVGGSGIVLIAILTAPISYLLPGLKNYIIPYGNYNANTFMTQLTNQLGSTFSMSLNPINNVFTLNNTSSFTINPSNIFQVMGFSQNTSYTSSSLVMPFPCNFNGIQSMNINFDNVQTANIDSLSKSNSSVIQSISVDNTSQQIFFNKTNDFFFEIKQNVIDFIQISIRDDLENLINFNNQHWNMTLQFSQLKNINRFHHMNDFNNILKNGYE